MAVMRVLCSCGGIHTVEEWKECPMAMTPRPIDYRERFTVQYCIPPRSIERRVADLILNVLMASFIFPLMYALIGAAKVADWWTRRRLRKSPDAAIQEPAKPRPRRAF
jgi:hypothetical protein